MESRNCRWRCRAKKKLRDLWRINCEQIPQYDVECGLKDAELAALKEELRVMRETRDSSETTTPVMESVPVPSMREALRPRPGLGSSDTRPRCSATMGTAGVAAPRRGKAPPVDSFTAENKEIRLDDWLPTLDRAATWNGWLEEERLIQLAGHLRGRALQEWGLLCSKDKTTFTLAVEALRSRLDTDNKALADQDFRHACQSEAESVVDYICRIERLFQIVYGRAEMKIEAREVLLYGQLHAGLK